MIPPRRSLDVLVDMPLAVATARELLGPAVQAAGVPPNLLRKPAATVSESIVLLAEAAIVVRQARGPLWPAVAPHTDHAVRGDILPPSAAACQG